MDKLKPCPFCGDNNPFVERMHLCSYAVRCNKCLATGEYSDEDSEMPEEDHELIAIKYWNKRTNNEGSWGAGYDEALKDSFLLEKHVRDRLKRLEELEQRIDKALDILEISGYPTGHIISILKGE